TLFEEVPTGQCMDLQGGDLLPPADGENPPDLFLLRNNWNTQGESQENLLYVFDPEQGRYLLRSDALPRDSELGIPDDDGNLIPNTHAGFLRRFKAILTDLNADGATDIAVAGERVSFYLNEGERMRFFPLVDTFDTDGSETLPHQFLRARVFSTLALHPIDLDGDPFPDLIAGNRGEQNRLLSNRGNLGGDPASWGGFADVTIDPAVFWPSGEMSLDASFADLDGNGATDVLFVVNGQTGEDSPGVDYAFRNAFYVSPNEDGRFRVLPDRDAEGTPLWPYEDGENSRGVTWADFNGDGFLDLAVANWGKNRAYFFDHFGTQGDPTFIDRSAFLFGGDEVNDRNSYDLAAGDLDGDRDPDLVVANLLAPAEVFLNDGSSWRRQELPETENLFVYGVALGDVNLDGSLDIVLATGGRVEPVRVGAKDLLFLNDGNGGFASPLPLGEEESVGKDVVVTDLNGDGFPEVVIANSGKETGGGTNLLYLNRGGDGEGMWLGLEPRAESLPGLPNHTEAVAAGDLDGDGDVDLVFSIVDTTGDFKRYGFGYATKVLINFCGGGCASPDFGDLTPLVLKMPLENVPWASLPLSPSAVPAMDEHVVYGLSLGYVRVGGVERPILVAAEDGQTRILLHREIPIP
ncbi:MAG: VCBS repeat-containing protein, partial [Deltaproteobacteria bacterium]